MILKFQSSIGPGLVQKLKIEEILLKFLNSRENDSGMGSCPSRSPNGNLVDGLPLVAIRLQLAAGWSPDNVDLFIILGAFFFELINSFITVLVIGIFRESLIKKKTWELGC